MKEKALYGVKTHAGSSGEGATERGCQPPFYQRPQVESQVAPSWSVIETDSKE